jgi:hypothetical protein
MWACSDEHDPIRQESCLKAFATGWMMLLRSALNLKAGFADWSYAIGDAG